LATAQRLPLAAIAGAKLGVTVHVATPQGFEPKPEIVEEAKNIARKTGARCTSTATR
jgi:ornithine carbamoyltransferase